MPASANRMNGLEGSWRVSKRDSEYSDLHLLMVILIEEERSKGISILAHHNDTETNLRP
jgi:hypothetical protein